MFEKAHFGVGRTQHNILGGLWEKLFASLSEGKMMFIFPGVPQKATWKVE